MKFPISHDALIGKEWNPEYRNGDIWEDPDEMEHNP